MITHPMPEATDPFPKLGLGALLILLLFVLFVGGDRRRAAGSIRLAAPTFVPLAPDAAAQVADQLGTAVGELLDASRPHGPGVR
jgi:hypothetical protein